MPDSIEALAGSLDTATSDGHLPDPALKISLENQNDQDSGAFVRTIRGRLIALGYLGASRKNQKSTKVDARFIKAVRKFQGEANLTQDAWVGPATWEKLQQLVSFEDHQDPRMWDLPANNKVVLRALYLRLYILGFMDWNRDQLNTRTKIEADNPTLTSALTNFLQVCNDLGMIPETFDAEIAFHSLSLVFSQDELIRSIDHSPAILRRRDRSEFLIAIARVELWMLGYDIKIGKPGQAPIKALNRAMKKFWKDNNDFEYYPTNRDVREGVSTNFFRFLAVQETELEGDGNDQEVILQKIDTLSDGEQISLQEKVKSITSSIWDGIKRLFRWLKKVVREAIAKAANLIKNIARLIARSSRDMFEIIAKAIDIFHRGVVFMKNAQYKGSDPRIVVIKHDNDFDHLMFVNESSGQSDRQEIIHSFIIESRAFQAACRLVGHLIAIFRFAIEVSRVGILGWFVLLTSLSRMYTRMNAMIQDIRDMDLLDVSDEESVYV